MRNIRYCIIAFCIGFSFISDLSADEEWTMISREWDTAMNEAMTGNAGPQRLETAAQALRAWRERQGPGYKWENEQQRGKFDLIDYHLADAWTRVGDYGRALALLEKEIQSYADSGGVFLHNTRNPDSFAMDVFELHSEIMSHTGNTNSIPNSGYLVFRSMGSDGKPRYVFVFQPYDEEEGGVSVGNLAADEERRTIQLTSPGENGRYKLADRAQVVAKKGRFTVGTREGDAETTVILGGVSKFVEYIGSGVPVVRNSSQETISLRVLDGKIEQPIQVLGLPSVLKKSSAAPPVDKAKTGANQGPNPNPLRASYPDQSQADRKGELTTPRWVATACLIGALILILGGMALWRRCSRRPS